MPAQQKIIERLEDSESIDRLARPLARTASRLTQPTPIKNSLSGTWLGHPLHPMLTDVPIGSWVAATALDVFGGRSGRNAARRLVGLGVLAAAPTAFAGWSDWSDTYGPEQRIGVVHALGNLSAVALQLASYLARRRGDHGRGRLLSLAGAGVMGGAAYLGGHLSYVRGIGVNHTAFEELPAEWTDVAAIAELAPDKPARVSAGGVPVVLVRHDDEVRALAATCVHAGGPLEEGQLVDGCLRCPWHGSMFELSSGKVVRGPATIPQPSLEVRLEEGRIQVRARTH